MSNINQKITQELEQLRPHLQADGGDVSFVDFDQETGLLKLQLQGACVGCPMRQMTLEQGIGRVLKEKIPQIKKIESI